MTAPTRTPGRTGRRTPKRAPAIDAARILTGIVPTHPDVQDNLRPLTGWKMLGNDRAGDCVAVSWASFRRLVTAVLAGHEVYPTQDQVWQVYRTQNPGFDPNGSAHTNGPGSDADRGMDIQTLLEYLVKTGGPDGVKAVAFAKVDPANLALVKAALSIFGGLWTGVTVQAANEDQFAHHKPWDYVPGSRNLGGHSVLSGGYLGATSGDVTFITWAAETSFTDRYWSSLVDECWLVVWPEHVGTKAFQDGVDLTALAADYKALTGRDIVLPDPPTPQPPNPPAETPALQREKDLAAVVKPWLGKPHSGSLAPVAAALKAELGRAGLL